jgi:hypothetical protein
MPSVSGKVAGAQATANACLNLSNSTGPMAGATTVFSQILEVPGLTNLTYLIFQGAGVDSMQAQVQVAFRRTTQGPGGLVFVSILPAVLIPPSGGTIPVILHVNTVAVQAMRIVFTHTGGALAPIADATYFLSASS